MNIIGKAFFEKNKADHIKKDIDDIEWLSNVYGYQEGK